VLADLVQQASIADAQQFRCPLAVPPGLLQSFADCSDLRFSPKTSQTNSPCRRQVCFAHVGPESTVAKFLRSRIFSRIAASPSESHFVTPKLHPTETSADPTPVAL
jgi:hypothetical protein